MFKSFFGFIVCKPFDGSGQFGRYVIRFPPGIVSVKDFENLFIRQKRHLPHTSRKNDNYILHYYTFCVNLISIHRARRNPGTHGILFSQTIAGYAPKTIGKTAILFTGDSLMPMRFDVKIGGTQGFRR
jgi:hypothetical protein